MRPGLGGLFVAFIHGQHYGTLLFTIDPNGAPRVPPEQVELMTYGENNAGIWAAFPWSDEYKSLLGFAAAPTSRIHIERQDLDTTIESSARLSGVAKTSFVVVAGGSPVLPLDLFGTLRVQSVSDTDGHTLSFVQEDKDGDPDFYVIFPHPLSAGERQTITTVYAGKDAVINAGNGNYYPAARSNWYPANAAGPFGDWSTYHMVLRIPAGMKMAASGSLVSTKEENGQSITEWESDVPQQVAGFQFGRMREEEAKLTSPEFSLATYANDEAPFGAGLGLSTVATMREPLSEAEFAIRLYTSYFGPVPFKRLSLAQQTACTYGQSWPDLVWLPICSYYARQLNAHGEGYWALVTPHEVAHQWWGQYVGFGSYRDQWMSEGFAQFSASLFLEDAYGTKQADLYEKFWKDQRKSLTLKNQFGYRAIDVGPLTRGYRLSNSRAGFDIYGDLIYPKGAYILQMLRMMMWSPETGDQKFKEMMQDFVKTYGGRVATTEDFKTTVEKRLYSNICG